MKKLLAFLFAALLLACGRPGSDYLGKWQADDGKHLIEISQNGESLLLKFTNPAYKGMFLSQPGTSTTTTFSGTIKDGVLKIDGPLGGFAVTHVKSDDTLLLPNINGGNMVYKRAK